MAPALTAAAVLAASQAATARWPVPIASTLLASGVAGFLLVRGRLSRRGRGVVVMFAILLRFLALLSPPLLSDDYQRFLWDGASIRAGLNPYLVAPAESDRVPPGAPLPSRINHPHLPTIYPPAALLLFAAAGSLAPGIVGLRALAAAADLALLLVLMLAGRGRPSDPVLVLWAFSPILLVEGLLELHPELLAAPFLALAMTMAWSRRTVMATLAGVAALLIKILPGLVLLPILLHEPRRRTRWIAAATAATVIGVAWLPFVLAGSGTGSGRRYALSWEANGPVYAVTTAVIDRTGIDQIARTAWSAIVDLAGHPETLQPIWSLLHPGGLARLLLAAALVVGATVILLRSFSVVSTTLRLGLLLLLLSPTVHPWYPGLLLPALMLAPDPQDRAVRFVLVWLATIPLAHLLPEGNRVADAPWLVTIEYALPAAAALIPWAAWSRMTATPSRPS